MNTNRVLLVSKNTLSLVIYRTFNHTREGKNFFKYKTKEF
jgi:hypothetical protein